MCPIENNDEIKNKKNVLNGNHSGSWLGLNNNPAATAIKVGKPKQFKAK